MIKILITGIGTFKGDGSNSITVGILGLTYIPVPMLLTGEVLLHPRFAIDTRLERGWVERLRSRLVRKLTRSRSFASTVFPGFF